MSLSAPRLAALGWELAGFAGSTPESELWWVHTRGPGGPHRGAHTRACARQVASSVRTAPAPIYLDLPHYEPTLAITQGDHEGLFLLVDAWTPGVWLGGHLRGAPHPVRVRRAILAGLAVALAELHAATITHEFLTTARIKLGFDGELRLVDAGRPSLLPAPLTGKGPVAGETDSAPLEDGQDLGPESDVFSFGVIAHYVLLGRRMHPGDLLARVEAARARASGRDPYAGWSDGSAIGLMLERASAGDRRARPAARELADALTPWLAPELIAESLANAPWDRARIGQRLAR